VKIGREVVTQATDAAKIAELRNKAPDTKETMEIGRDWDKTWRNHWPQESDAPGFKQTMLDFFKVRATHVNTFVLWLTIVNRLAMRLIAS
jgi:hypothetical protein